MKKNYWLLIIFLVLGAGTVWYLITSKDTQSKNTLGWDRKFAVPNTDEIGKIFLAQRTGETTTLEREGDHWMANGQKASPNAVENILEAISQVELRFVPPQAAVEGVVKSLAARGIKVEIYDRSGNQLKSYYVGGVSPDARATFFIMENAEQPMAVGLPNMDGQIRTRYELKGDDWRDKTVFGYQPEEIRSVSIEYPKQRNKSFLLEREGDGFKVTPFYDNVPPIQREVVKGRVEGFLVGFESLVAESYDNRYAKKDSIRQTIPFSIISVTDIKGQEKKAVFYPAYRVNSYTGDKKTDYIERYFADVSTGDWMLTQHRVFQPVFVAYEGFFEPPGKAIKD